MIPKIIHYCWFSGEKKPRSIRRCIDSWKKFMPDYEIKCWDSKSFDFESVPFVRDAMNAKKYAFAADYVRLYALYNEGGIYLDSDVLVFKKFDTFLSDEFFCGTEAYLAEDSVHFRMEPAIMGACNGHQFLRECISFYKSLAFDLEKTTSNYIMPIVISKLGEEYGYRYNNEKQQLDSITIYPTSVFANTLYQDSTKRNDFFAIHQNYGSWIDYSNRGWLFHLCRKFDIMKIYHIIEQINNI